MYKLGSRNKKSDRRLVKSNADITLDSGSQVYLGLEVKLDTDKEGGGLLVAVLVCGTLEKLAWYFVSKSEGGIKEGNIPAG